MHKIIILFCFAALMLSCRNTPLKTSTQGQQAITTQALPPVPASFLIEMFQKIDHIDYYFRKTNFSVSQDTKEAVQSFISMLSDGKASKVSDSCVSPLRMTFLANGNIEFETEMYMSENCMYVEYYINNVKTYQSNYSEDGFNFLVNLIERAKSAK